MGRGRSWMRRFDSVVSRCPRIRAPRPVLRRPLARRLLLMAGVAAAGWLLGVAGQGHADQAHADIVPGVRLPSAVAPVGRVTTIVDHVLTERPGVSAVRLHDLGTILAPARPPAILALPPAAKHMSRPRTPVGSAGPSRTRRHGDAGSRAGIAGGPVTHIGPRAVTGASEKASTGHAAHRAPFFPWQRRPLPQKGQALPPSAGAGGIHQAGVRRKTEPGTAHGRPVIPILRIGTIPPAVRTAADEPSFSPD